MLLATVITTKVLDFAVGARGVEWRTFLQHEILAPSLDLVEIGKTLVFQGTFLLALSTLTMVVAFSFREILAALRAPQQPADEASVASRAQYFLRSVATFRTARAVWLYGGAMIGTLTAIRMLSDNVERSLIETILYILGPSVVGFIGYSWVRRATERYVSAEPALGRLVTSRVHRAREAQREASLAELERVPRHYRLLALAAPIACLAGYLAWLASRGGLESSATAALPVTTKDWLLALPYVVLFPVLLFRDAVERFLLRRRREASERPE
jgi:hypothetical protein